MITLYNQEYDVGAYHTYGDYASDAYKFQMIVQLNNQYEDLRNNITIKWYATAKNPFGYSNYNNINVTLDLTAKGSTKRVYTGTRKTLSTGVKTLIATYTGDVVANDDGTLTISVSGFYDGGVSQNYLPRKHTKNTGNLVLPAINVNPKPFIKLSNVWKKTVRQFLKVAGSFHLIKKAYVKINGHWVRSK